jgi:hypothetical protein
MSPRTIDISRMAFAIVVAAVLFAGASAPLLDMAATIMS